VPLMAIVGKSVIFRLRVRDVAANRAASPANWGLRGHNRRAPV